MSRRTFSITSQPVGTVYTGLLATGARFCHRALLVVRPSLGLDLAGRELLRQLTAFNGLERTASEWPGTRLLKGTATTFAFDLNAETLLLLGAVPGLYSWRQPERPEDLCLLRPTGAPWLGSISHERDAFLELDEAEEMAVRESVPGLTILLDP